MSVTNLGLRPIRNSSKHRAMETTSVTNLGLRPIRNWFSLLSLLDASVTNLGLRPIRNQAFRNTWACTSVTNLGLRPIRNCGQWVAAGWDECNQSWPETNPQPQRGSLEAPAKCNQSWPETKAENRAARTIRLDRLRRAIYRVII